MVISDKDNSPFKKKVMNFDELQQAQQPRSRISPLSYAERRKQLVHKRLRQFRKGPPNTIQCSTSSTPRGTRALTPPLPSKNSTLLDSKLRRAGSLFKNHSVPNIGSSKAFFSPLTPHDKNKDEHEGSPNKPIVITDLTTTDNPVCGRRDGASPNDAFQPKTTTTRSTTTKVSAKPSVAASTKNHSQQKTVELAQPKRFTASPGERRLALAMKRSTTNNSHSAPMVNNNNNHSATTSAGHVKKSAVVQSQSLIGRHSGRLSSTNEASGSSQPRPSTQSSFDSIAKSPSNKEQPKQDSQSSVLAKMNSKKNQDRQPLSPSNITSRNGNVSGPSTRRNLDKRTARLAYSDDFAKHIEKSRNSPVPANVNSEMENTIKVFVRKRPIFSKDLAKSDFDVVQVLKEKTIVYRTSMGADMKTKLVQPVVFSGLSAAFDESISNDIVYKNAVRPLVRSVLNDNKAASLLMFGQTGSGKTYTMTACQKLVAVDLFKNCSQVQVQCLELIGKKCHDLMNPSTDTVRVVDNDDGSVSFLNAVSKTVDSPRELLSTLVQSQKQRATESTTVNEVSSRSHAIYRMKIDNSRGVLTLLDCAGTERRNDSLYHSKERQAESTAINASLYTLKECIRARSKLEKCRVPYRSSNLTRVLRESLEQKDACLSVIATVSPNATDTEHTIQTLKTLAKLTGMDLEEGASEALVTKSKERRTPPKKWNKDELAEWLVAKKLVRSSKNLPSLDGRAVMRMNRIQLQNAFFDCDPDAKKRADTLFQKLRAATGSV